MRKGSATAKQYPDFYLVGAPKCGTTAMYSALRQHPQIFLPPRKELFYFGTDLNYDKRLSCERFLRNFRGRQDETRVGCAHTAYMQSTRAAHEIGSARPDADIIIMLRNPVQMLHSWHSELLYGAIEDIEDFEVALDAEPDRRRGLRIPRYATYTDVDKLYYSEVASFTEQVRRYLDVFGREHVCVIIHDDLRENSASTYRATLDFLGVDADFVPQFEVLNPSKSARSRTLQHLLLRTRGPIHDAARRILPGPVRRSVIAINTRYGPRPEIEPAVERRLANQFRADVGQLGDLLDRDLSHWVAAPEPADAH